MVVIITTLVNKTGFQGYVPTRGALRCTRSARAAGSPDLLSARCCSCKWFRTYTLPRPRDTSNARIRQQTIAIACRITLAALVTPDWHTHCGMVVKPLARKSSFVSVPRRLASAPRHAQLEKELTLRKCTSWDASVARKDAGVLITALTQCLPTSAGIFRLTLWPRSPAHSL